VCVCLFGHVGFMTTPVGAGRARLLFAFLPLSADSDAAATALAAENPGLNMGARSRVAGVGCTFGVGVFVVDVSVFSMESAPAAFLLLKDDCISFCRAFF
jgi:hypothetical protein